MKKAIITLNLLILFTCTTLLAHDLITPYGSARIGFWYENEDEVLSGVEDGTLNLNYYLQGNSYFGISFSSGKMDANVEFDGRGNIDELWASYTINDYAIIIGQTATLIDFGGSMVYDQDNNFDGWGAIDDGGRALIGADFKNGFSLRLIQPEQIDIEGIDQEKRVLLPKINLGFEKDISDKVGFTGAFGLNMYSYDENQGTLDESVLSYVAGLMFDVDFDNLELRLHANFGHNTGNYGLESETYNTAIWDSEKEEVVDVMTFGGFSEISYILNDQSLITFGASYSMSDSNIFDEKDTAFAAFVHLNYGLAENFRIIPEIGLLDNMKDRYGDKQGRLFYFGTQLSMDF